MVQLIESGATPTCWMIDLAGLHSIRNRDGHARVRARRAFACRKIELTETILNRVICVRGLLPGSCQHRLAIHGLIIAADAESPRMTVLHHDTDSDAIAAVTGQDSEWIAPRGPL